MGSDESLGLSALVDSAVFTFHGAQMNMIGVFANKSKVRIPRLSTAS